MFIFQLFQNPGYFVSVVVVVIISITIHELFHALAALSQGDDTAAMAGRLTLNPAAHMGQTSIVMLMLVGVAWGATPVNESRFRWPFSRALVSFAGPFANLLMMVVSIWLVLLLKHYVAVSPAELMPWQDSAVEFFSLGAILNAFLFLLNMLPIPPLDGYGVLETFFPFMRRYSISLSQYGLFILIVLFFFLGFQRWLFAVAAWMVGTVTQVSQGILLAL